MRGLTGGSRPRQDRLYFVALAFLWCFVFAFLFQNISIAENTGLISAFGTRLWLDNTTIAVPETDTEDVARKSSPASTIGIEAIDDIVADAQGSLAETGLKYSRVHYDKSEIELEDKKAIAPVEYEWPTESDLIPWNTDGIKAKCDAAEWREHLYFQCDMNDGGFGNVRNTIVNCLRYAIEVGAKVVMPKIWQRDAVDLSNLEANLTTLDYLFDADFFTETIQTNCPQLKLLASVADVPYFAEALVPKPLIPRSLLPDQVTNDIPHFYMNEHASEFRARFDSWLTRDVGVVGPMEQKKPVIVRLGRHVYFEWPLHDDPEDFWMYMGRVVRPRSDIATLAAEALFHLEGLVAASHYDVDESDLPSQNPNLSSFFGAHLRMESDVPDTWKAHNEQVIKDIVDRAREKNYKLIFVATGDQQNYLDLKAEAALVGVEVINKHDLLTPESQERLETYTFDQTALIDYLILSKSGYFTGHRYSSFSQSVASYRILTYEDPERRVRTSDEGESHLLRGGEWEQGTYWRTIWP